MLNTANALAAAINPEHDLPYSSANPALSAESENADASAAIRLLLEKDIKPKDIMTRAAFESAITVIMVLGGSTNAVLHLIAMARSVGVPLDQDDFQKISNHIPVLADFKPSGKYLMQDLHQHGGIPAVMRYLLDSGLLHGDCLTVTGKTLAENLAGIPAIDFTKQDIILPLERPIKATSTYEITTAISPGRRQRKQDQRQGREKFEGPARVFDGEHQLIAGINSDIRSGDVIVIEYVGPKAHHRHAGG